MVNEPSTRASRQPNGRQKGWFHIHMQKNELKESRLTQKWTKLDPKLKI